MEVLKKTNKKVERIIAKGYRPALDLKKDDFFPETVILNMSQKEI